MATLTQACYRLLRAVDGKQQQAYGAMVVAAAVDALFQAALEEALGYTDVADSLQELARVSTEPPQPQLLKAIQAWNLTPVGRAATIAAVPTTPPPPPTEPEQRAAESGTSGAVATADASSVAPSAATVPFS